MEKLRTTPSQTVGPFFAYSLTAEQYGYDFNSLVNGNLTGENIHNHDESGTEGVSEIQNPKSEIVTGERIFITGRILDGNGNTINDAMIELWQADPKGQYRLTPINHKNDGFTGFGRLGTGTNAAHRFTFETLKPASPEIQNPKSKIASGQAPHINVILFMRGSLRHLYTRLYFSDETKANVKDPLLKTVKANRRNTLIAQRQDINGQIFYTFDIKMQGEEETVFFDMK
jgi:protocatechuate 3,4-dioxygenase, alpha subunit